MTQGASAMPKTALAPITVEQLPPGSEIYGHDDHEWIAARIGALNDGNFHPADRANLVEYLTAMIIRDRRELRSRLVVLLHRLLKVQFQSERLTRSR
jgi:hypothetical protein